MEWMAEAEAALERDPFLGPIIAAQKPIRREARRNYFLSLSRAIIGQQVSVAAASSIFGRYESLTGCLPEKVAVLTDETSKEIGLSRQKLGYLRDLAGHFVANPAVYDHLEKLSDDEIVAELTKVKGIGPWTAQMFMMSVLLRPDVFAPDDLGLLTALKRLHKMEALPKRAEALKMAESWAPYRTMASWHLWDWLDTPA